MVMKNIQIYENFNQRTMILRHKMSGEITVELEGSQIKNVINNTNIRFPFNVGSIFNRSIETWACNNGFKVIETWMNGRMQRSIDPCPEEKIFGIRKKDIPQGHELRMLYPHKFRN
jgi:hypothetical protein